MSSRTVVDTGKHVELALAAADACIRSTIIGDFTWSSRKVTVTRAGKASFTESGKDAFYPLHANVEIVGKIGGQEMWVRVYLLGHEDLSGPGSVHRQDDVSGPQYLGVDLVRIQATDPIPNKVWRRAFEVGDMPSNFAKPMKMPSAVI